MSEIASAAVLGAGVMGAAIAAHLANAGLSVLLLDLVPKEGRRRNALAEAALERLKKSEPPAFMHPSAAAGITAGNLEDDLGRLSDVDWTIEAIVEDLELKQGLLARAAAATRPDAILSSNTSTLTLESLRERLPEQAARRLLVTHFFNPPRYVRLLELVIPPGADPDAVAAITSCAEERLGKTVVTVEDRPGFIANRIGSFWIQSAVTAALELGLTVEEVDAVVTAAFGVPKTGIFGLLDLVGLDLACMVAASLRARLPPDDPCHTLPPLPAIMQTMITDGRTGRKGASGFYRLAQEGGRRVKEALDLVTDRYRPAVSRPRLESLEVGRKDLRSLLDHPDRGGRFAARVMTETLAYAAHVLPEIADDVAAPDRAMRLGYGWAAGPFELLDRLGTEWVADQLRRFGQPVPRLLEEAGERETFYRKADGSLVAARDRQGRYRELKPRPGTLRLDDVKARQPAVATNTSASLWDLGEDVACVEFHSKLNTLDRDSLAMLRLATEIVPQRFKALVIGNDAENFSAGVNLGLALYAANLALWPLVEQTVELGQHTFQALKYAPFPVVGAPSGLALGGGCEVLLHCDAVEAHAESYIGLVELAVGLLPAWGGSTQYLIRWLTYPDRPGGLIPAVSQGFRDHRAGARLKVGG